MKGKIVRTKILVLVLLAVAVVFLVLQRAENDSPSKRVGVSKNQALRSSLVTKSKRRAKKCGGNVCSERSENLGLKWLADNQLPEGNWDNMKWGECFYSEAGITGLALLAFVGAGHTERFGKYRRVVQKAMKWLANHQDASGNLAPGDNIENHAIAALALLEEVAMASVPSTREICKKGIDYLHSVQNKNSGWGVKVGDKDSDLITTTWCVMAMGEARIARCDVPTEACEGAKRFLDSVSDPYSGRVGRFSRPSKPEENKIEEETLFPACAMICKHYFGVNWDDSALNIQAALLATNLPNLKQKGIDDKFFTYWYLGTLGLFLVGGNNWRKWKLCQKNLLIADAITKKGELRGSWNPAKKAVLGRTNGRVFSTAMAILTLETCFTRDIFRGSGQK